MGRARRRSGLVLALGLAAAAATSQVGRESLSISERTDFSRYVDGKYLGHVYREARGFFEEGEAGILEGEVFFLEESIHDARASSREVELSTPARLWRTRSGRVEAAADGVFPSYRGLLAGLSDPPAAGSAWTAPATLAFQVAGGASLALLPVLVEYRIGQRTTLEGRPVLRVAALFAPRHPGSGSRNASFEAAGVLTLAGRHELDLYLDEADGSLVFLRDRFDDSLGLAGGRIERRSGFTLVFYRGGTLAGRAAELASLQGSVVAPAAQGARAEADEAPAAEGRAPDGSPVAANADAGEGGALGAGAGPLMMAESVLPEAPSALAAAGVDLLDTGRAIVLRVRDLRFLPDSDSILPSERDRIDLLAAALLKLPGRSFLVEGHAASTGRPEGELELSKLRAKRLVDELVLRGIPASALIYRGLGSTRPLASNDTEEGRAQNRRVEITILE